MDPDAPTPDPLGSPGPSERRESREGDSARQDPARPDSDRQGSSRHDPPKHDPPQQDRSREGFGQQDPAQRDLAQRDTFTAANRVMWNETADVHAKLKLDGLREGFRDPTFTVLDEIETAALRDVGVAGKDVVQLSCNNGRELLSVERMGARRCVGFDISDKFIAQAHELADIAGSRAEFVATDVYEIPSDYDGAFDVAYVTIGALGWFPDLRAWFSVAARLLRPGGHLVIYEMHPILDMFDPAEGPVLNHSYFRTEPYYEAAAPDYYDPTENVAAESYWFHHTMADVIGGALGSGMEIRRFEEFGHDISMVFRAFQDLEAKPPLSYLLVAQKRG